MLAPAIHRGALARVRPPSTARDRPPSITRRRFLEGSALGSAAVLLGACDRGDGDESRPRASTETEPEKEAQRLTPTPACDDGDDPTPQQTEGPFYTPDTPRRTRIATAGVRGEPLLVTGLVLGNDCRPIRRALLDFWQADGAGEYDNEGYRLRGHQFTDDHGRFRLETVKPGLYTGRTRHIHVKAQRPQGEILTTRLYFPGEPANQSDGIFDPALLMDVDGRRARFDFVLA
jgi:protocatechuate 3,4-dioxygenase beta subunit